MRAILVRIGIDLTFGKWNAPFDSESGAFLFVPIPERAGMRFHPGCRREFREIAGELKAFCGLRGICPWEDLAFPRPLLRRAMHLDPDFSQLTYGDNGGRRGSRIATLAGGDLLVFYSAMRPLRAGGDPLVYALIGLYEIDAVLAVGDVERARWHENAHSRRADRCATDIVVRARAGVSGRFTRAIPIGEGRKRSYRVREELLEAWGGLSVSDGYIQRSAVPPEFLDAERFRRWLEGQRVELIPRNN